MQDRRADGTAELGGREGLPRGTIRPLSVAPMMDRTDRHFRYFMRGVTRHALLYTEMVVARALVRGDAARLLAHHAAERPLALQLGGDDPRELSTAARMAFDAGFDEVNLNVGCPSDRVQRGRFGACLMAEPERVAECVAAMRAAVPLPVTVKHRLGIDDRDAYEDTLGFVDAVARAGCDRFTVHARKAWLSGLSPRENREVPPLRYEQVYRLKVERPALTIELNGGVLSLDEARAHRAAVDAVMIGRAAWDDPFAFAGADRLLFGEVDAQRTRREAVLRMVAYLESAHDEPPAHVLRVMAGLATGRPGARAWRRALAAVAASARPPEALVRAMAVLPLSVLDESGA